MRRLLQRRVVVHSVAGGILLTGLCLPYVVSASPPGTLGTLRAAFLLPLAMVVLQAALAWTPCASGNGMFQWDRDLWPLVLPIGGGLLLSAICVLWLDRCLATALPGLMAREKREFLLALPWVALFQPLLLVAGVYAFAARLSHSHLAATAIVVLVHQALVLQQFGTRLDAPALIFAAMLTSGFYALMMTTAYASHGFLGAVLIATIRYARFLFAS